jgi:two-component system cell cycle sensor histidine kinase/response regulator CckA
VNDQDKTRDKVLEERHGPPEEALWSSREWLEAIFRASRDGIVVEADEKVVFANEAAARLHGFEDPREMAGLPCTSFQLPEDSARMLEYGRKRLRGEPVPSVYPFRGRCKDGSAIDLEASVSTCRLGGKDYIITIVRDIRERKKLEERLRQAQKLEALGRVTGGVAHVFNNQMTVVLGYCDVLLADLPAGDPQRQGLLAIRKAGERAALVTRQLLAFGRQQILVPRVLDLNALLESLAVSIRSLVRAEVAVVTVLDPDLGPVRVDPGQMEAVILALVCQATQAMPRGGTLTIHTGNADVSEGESGPDLEFHPGPYAVLAVTDTGPGMDEAERARLFEPFSLGQNLGDVPGLDLAACYGIVKQSGGHIAVETAPGRGTTFRVYLPRCDLFASRGPAREAETRPSVPAPRGAVLVVEDDEGVRRLLVHTLRGDGWAVHEAADGLEALRFLERNHTGPIDLVVTDMIMPRMNGRELSERLSQVRPGIKVLYLSGHTEDMIDRHQVSVGQHSFLPKPFTPAALVAKVRALVGR